MTKLAQHTIVLILMTTITLAGIAIVLITNHPFTQTTVEMTTPEFPNPTPEITIPEFLNPIFTHKDTGIQMRFFGTADNDYYYLQSVLDHHWTWYGTHQEFIAQFQRIEPPLAQKGTKPLIQTLRY